MILLGSVSSSIDGERTLVARMSFLLCERVVEGIESFDGVTQIARIPLHVLERVVLNLVNLHLCRSVVPRNALLFHKRLDEVIVLTGPYSGDADIRHNDSSKAAESGSRLQPSSLQKNPTRGLSAYRYANLTNTKYIPSVYAVMATAGCDDRKIKRKEKGKRHAAPLSLMGVHKR